MAGVTPDFSNLKTINFTYQTPQETLLGTPETLPMSEPATPQVSYTVASGDLPIIDIPVESKKWIGMVIGAGRVVTGAILSWRMKKNGYSVNLGQLSTTTNYRYTIQAWFYDVTVGDVLELALWSNVADSLYDYKAYQIHVTRITPYYLKVHYRFFLQSIIAQPVLTLGTPTTPTANWYIYVIHRGYNFTPNGTSYFFRTNIGGWIWSIIVPDEVMGLVYTRHGDISNQNSVTTTTHATSRPRYYRNYLPSLVRFRYLTIKELIIG